MTNEEGEKCDCGQYMKEVADLGGMVQITDHKFNVIGVRTRKLYQCSECKNVAVD